MKVGPFPKIHFVSAYIPDYIGIRCLPGDQDDRIYTLRTWDSIASGSVRMAAWLGSSGVVIASGYVITMSGLGHLDCVTFTFY